MQRLYENKKFFVTCCIKLNIKACIVLCNNHIIN